MGSWKFSFTTLKKWNMYLNIMENFEKCFDLVKNTCNINYSKHAVKNLQILEQSFNKKKKTVRKIN